MTKNAIFLNMLQVREDQETPPAAFQLPQQPDAASPSKRAGYGRAVELASAVMCPMKQSGHVMEAVWGGKLGMGILFINLVYKK